MTDITIIAVPNGPYVITGAVKMVDGEGKESPITNGKVARLQGGSESKPFCDGTHAKINFRSDTKAS